MNSIDKHFEDRKQKKDRLSELNRSIKENETKLSDKEAEYKKAVVEDGQNIDKLFQELDDLKVKIKADKHKLATLQSVTNDHLRSDAVKVVEEFSAIKSKHQKKADKALEHIEKAKKSYIKELSVLDGINTSYHEDRNKFERLISMYDITTKEPGINKMSVIKIRDIADITPSKMSKEILSEDIRKELYK